MKPKFIELTPIDFKYKSLTVNVAHILYILPYEDEDDGSMTFVELTTRDHWFGRMLKVAETIEEIMQKIGG